MCNCFLGCETHNLGFTEYTQKLTEFSNRLLRLCGIEDSRVLRCLHFQKCNLPWRFWKVVKDQYSLGHPVYVIIFSVASHLLQFVMGWSDSLPLIAFLNHWTHPNHDYSSSALQSRWHFTYKKVRLHLMNSILSIPNTRETYS